MKPATVFRIVLGFGIGLATGVAIKKLPEFIAFALCLLLLFEFIVRNKTAND
jgi:hypothetical protein